MATGNDLVLLAKKHIGEKYVFGVIAPKDDGNYGGPWDCAEFASWLIMQVTGKLYGCANNNGKPHGADAYSGFWARDARVLGILVSIEEAARTAGCFLTRVAADGTTGHVAMTKGDGGTIEAHSTKAGVGEYLVTGRHWDYAIKIPWITYEASNPVPVTPPKEKIYKYINPVMHDDFVKKIQKATGLTGNDVDGLYGKTTFVAVRAFQLGYGLVPDGEVGDDTKKALSIS